MKYDNNGERVHNLPWANITFENGNAQFDYFNTWIREYRDDPQFNHVDWMNEEGQCLKVLLPPEAMDKLKEMGFRRTGEIIPSTEVEEWFVAMLMQDVDVEELTVPLDFGV